jgi:hypothetical protein
VHPFFILRILGILPSQNCYMLNSFMCKSLIKIFTKLDNKCGKSGQELADVPE